MEPLDREECAHVEVAVLARGKPSHVWQNHIPGYMRAESIIKLGLGSE